MSTFEGTQTMLERIADLQVLIEEGGYWTTPDSTTEVFDAFPAACPHVLVAG